MQKNSRLFKKFVCKLKQISCLLVLLLFTAIFIYFILCDNHKKMRFDAYQRNATIKKCFFKFSVLKSDM